MVSWLVTSSLVLIMVRLPESLTWSMYLPITGYLCLCMALVFELPRWLKLSAAKGGKGEPCEQGIKYDWRILAGLGLIGLVTVIQGNLVHMAWWALMLGVYTLGANSETKIKSQVLVPAILAVSAYEIWDGLTHGVAVTLNYNLISGFLIVGCLLCTWKHRWWALYPVVLLAVYLSSAREAILALVVIGVIAIVRKDWSKKMLPTVAMCLVVVVLEFIVLGVQSGNIKGILEGNVEQIIGYRAEPIERAMSGLNGRKWLIGSGYHPEWVTSDAPHNTPILFLTQLGIVGLLGWLLTTGFSLKKGSYVMAVIIAISLVDHYWWTLFLPVTMWLLAQDKANTLV